MADPHTTDPDEVPARLGPPVLVCRISPRTLFGGYLMASLPVVVGALVLLALYAIRAGDWTKDVVGTLVFLAAAGAAFYGGWVLWRRTNRLRLVRATVHAGGLSYWDATGRTTCRWDQIEDIRWKALDHYEESVLVLGGVVPVPGTAIREFSHSTHRVTVRRMEGAPIVLTNEIENIVGLAGAILAGVERSRGGS